MPSARSSSSRLIRAALLVGAVPYLRLAPMHIVLGVNTSRGSKLRLCGDQYHGVDVLERGSEADELSPEAMAEDAHWRVGERVASPGMDCCLVLATPGGGSSIAMANRPAARLPGAAVVVGDRAKAHSSHMGGEARALALIHTDRALDDQVSARCWGRVGRALNLVLAHFHGERLALDDHVLVVRWRREGSERDKMCNGDSGDGEGRE